MRLPRADRRRRQLAQRRHPHHRRALDPSSTEQLWILDAYALVFAGLLLLCGALGDRYGRKNTLIVGLAIFGVASTVAAYADTPTQLILYRAVMGVGAR